MKRAHAFGRTRIGQNAGKGNMKREPIVCSKDYVKIGNCTMCENTNVPTCLVASLDWHDFSLCEDCLDECLNRLQEFAPTNSVR